MQMVSIVQMVVHILRNEHTSRRCILNGHKYVTRQGGKHLLIYYLSKAKQEALNRTCAQLARNPQSQTNFLLL